MSQEQKEGEDGSTPEEEVEHKEMFHLVVSQKLQDDDTPFYYMCKHARVKKVGGMRMGGVEGVDKEEEAREDIQPWKRRKGEG